MINDIFAVCLNVVRWGFFFQMIIYSLVIIILVDVYEILAINNKLISLENDLLYKYIKTSNDLELFYRKIHQSNDLKFISSDSGNLNTVNRI